MIYFCCHFEWAHWIGFLSLFALRPQNDHSYYHVAKAIINNKPSNQLHIDNQLACYFLSNTTMFCKQRLKLVHWHFVFRTLFASFFVTLFRSVCGVASCHNALINIQVKSLTLSANNPLFACLCTSFTDYIINNRLTFTHFPPNMANEFRQPVFNIMLFRRISPVNLVSSHWLSHAAHFIKRRYQMSSELLRHMKSLNP